MRSTTNKGFDTKKKGSFSVTESFLFFVVCYDEWLSSVGRDVGLVDGDEGLVADVVGGGETGILAEDDLVVEDLHLTTPALGMGA
ncbi:MAG: hypothetical protein J5954_07505, partial [Prevotella sp.]|nr:hypothetical protein [Prevotella sp.]